MRLAKSSVTALVCHMLRIPAASLQGLGDELQMILDGAGGDPGAQRCGAGATYCASQAWTRRKCLPEVSKRPLMAGANADMPSAH
jgi:hypothetical protein